MKKILLVTILVLIVVMGMASVALANGGPHGGYTPTTDACAGCHRAHTAAGTKLLVQANTLALCMSCHGNAGTGADTNVEGGFYLSTRSLSTDGAPNSIDNDPLNAGGFINAYNEVATAFQATTSTHDVSNTVNAAWGYGVNRGATAALIGGLNLNCASCHDPHGSTNYRILNTTVNGVGVVVTQVDEGAAKNYTAESWPADITDFCAACHDAYHNLLPADDPSLSGTGGYAHTIDMSFNYSGNVNPETVGFGGYNLPLAGADAVTCNTCHLSHGSSAAMAGFADNGGLPGNTAVADSALLRLDNRGVCEVCHQK